MKIIKKTIISCLSFLGISFACWLVVLMNPGIMYANHTTFDQVTIYHNQPLQQGAENIIKNAIGIIQNSELYHADMQIDLCLNDGSYYPNLWIYKGATAYAFLNKAVIYDSKIDFEKNVAEYSWEVNDFEIRKFNLTWLLAHEFTHTLQSKMDRLSPAKFDFWKNEGHAEYIAHQYKNDGRLKQKIAFLLEEQQKTHRGLPVFMLDDNTVVSLDYFKYGLMVQYLFEQENLNYKSIGNDTRTEEEIYTTMLQWYGNQ